MTGLLATRKAIRDTKCHFDPVYWAKKEVGFVPDEWQARALACTDKEVMFLCCRQSGKSTIAALKAVHYARYHPHSLIVLISPSQRQSSELFRKVRYQVIAKMKTPPKLVEDNLTSLRMANGSRIVALPSSEETIVGFSAASILIEDESSRVPDEIQAATLPFLATTDGQYIQLSTPKKKRGHFYRDWTDSKATKFRVVAKDVPRIAKDFLERMKVKLGSKKYAQEFDCEFLEDAEGDMIHREWLVNNAVKDWPRDMSAIVRFWDRASTEPAKNDMGEDETDPDWTAGVKMGEKDGQVWIIHVERFRDTSGGNQSRIKSTAIADGQRVNIRMEEEGGSSGKDTIYTYSTSVLAGYNFLGRRSTGSKVERAEAFAAACEAGNVHVVMSDDWDWQGFIDRLSAFPSLDVHDDEVDGCSGAYNELMQHKRGKPVDKKQAVVRAEIPTMKYRR